MGPNRRGHPGPVIAHEHAGDPPLRLDADLDVAAAPTQSVNRILDQRLERPFDEDAIAERSRPGTRRVEYEGHGARQGRQAGPEIAHHPLGHRAESHRLAARGPPNALESFGDPLQPLRIRFEMVRHLKRGSSGVFAQRGNPPSQAHERGAELMGRLARHRHPQPIARGPDLGLIGPGRECCEAHKHEGLEHGQEHDPPSLGRRTVVDGADARLHDRVVHPIEIRDPGP